MDSAPLNLVRMTRSEKSFEIIDVSNARLISMKGEQRNY